MAFKEAENIRENEGYLVFGGVEACQRLKLKSRVGMQKANSQDERKGNQTTEAIDKYVERNQNMKVDMLADIHNTVLKYIL